MFYDQETCVSALPCLLALSSPFPSLGLGLWWMRDKVGLDCWQGLGCVFVLGMRDGIYSLILWKEWQG